MHARNRTWPLGSDPAERCRQRTLPVEGGDGSTLSLDFTTGVLDPRLTFTRSTSGTYIGADGLVKTMAAAPTNDPTKARFDYDPITLAPRGLLIEASANNLLNWSESFATSGGTNNNWADTNITRNSTNNTDPANGTSALRVTASAGNGTIISTAAIGTSAQRTFSIWLRRVSGTGNIQYTLDNGSTYTTQAITSSWVRYAFAATTAAQRVGIRIVTSGDSIELWGAQLEDGSGASSYIPTGASQGSRAYDHCYATGANFTSWFSVGAGTMVAVSDNIKNNLQNLVANISDDSASNYIRMGFKVGGSANEYLLTTVGLPPPFQGAADSGYAPPLNTVYKMAYAWDTNNFGIVANGGAVGTDLSGTLAGAGVLNRLVVGGDFVAVPNDFYFKNGHIRSLKYWPTRLSNAQLQALTT